MPRISIVMPTLNQGRFIERSILSILNQAYPDVELIIVDGGSTDETHDIVARYRDRITCWISEPDEGQADALNKGIKFATGDLIGWQNSDDLYLPGVFQKVADAYRGQPGCEVYFGDVFLIDESDAIVHETRHPAFCLDCMLYADGWNLHNQAMFFGARTLKKEGFDTNFQYAMDGEYLVRMARRDGRFVRMKQTLGCFRLQPQGKTALIRSTVRDAEWHRIRLAAGVLVRPGVPWDNQYRLRRAACGVRKVLSFLVDGDLAYVLRKAFTLLSGR